ncbi:MAG TPA: hypothetical protein VEF89_21185 [Solirubrobacteraceae bacterium]|nr:hypothetical protein [Solirubrobacteraceae bacterium]
MLVALIAAGLGQASARPLTWAGYAGALVGIALVAGSAGGGATTHGDLLVLGSAVLSAGFIVVQPRLLAGRDAAAITGTSSRSSAPPPAGLRSASPPPAGRSSGRWRCSPESR